MIDLIARLETATEPSRELDALIALSKPDCPPQIELDKEPGYLWEPGVGSVSSRRFPVKHYTASIDAALTLVPERWSWRVKSLNIEGEMLHSAMVNFEFEHEAATPALAICIAALKARKQDENNN